MKNSQYVAEIIEDIRNKGSSAFHEYCRKFDGYSGDYKVTGEEIEKGSKISENDKEVIRETISRIKDHHEKQLPEDELYEKSGSVYGNVHRPIERVGLYVPGGKPLPSSLLMTAVPARVAGVEEIIVISPPHEGTLSPHLLFIAEELNIEEVYKVGGIQGIAGLAFGIVLPRVDKIFGPGNKYVTEAKRQVFGQVGIHSLAGPSEICVVADQSADEEYVLADLLSQLEHDEDSRAFLLTTDSGLADHCRGTDIEIEKFSTPTDCIERSNRIGPEHLEIITQNPWQLLPDVKNAGAVYLDEYTPVAAGDYFLGVNHVLPTGGTAKFDSVLSTADFFKKISVAQTGKKEFQENRDLGRRLAEIEEMEEHKKALEVRKGEKKD